MIVFTWALIGSIPVAGAAFDLSTFTGLVADSSGGSVTQAGSHPYSASTDLTFPLLGPGQPDGSVKEVQVDLPPGFVGNPSATPIKCTSEQLSAGQRGECPVSAQLGVAKITTALPFQGPSVVAIYNLAPPPDAPALLGFRVFNQVAFIVPSVRTGGDYGITVRSPEIAQLIPLAGISVTLWGVPADPSHDADRGTPVDAGLNPGGTLYCAETSDPACTNPAGYSPTAFLTLPTNCLAGAQPTVARAFSWQEPTIVHTKSFDTDTNGEPTAVFGCDRLPFAPTLSAEPTTSAPDAPTGLKTNLSIPQDSLESPGGLAQAHLKKAVVTLPAGVSVNPSSADGLSGCALAEINLTGPSAAQAPTCPDSSKVGTVEVDTPLVETPLHGNVYLAKQYENPFGSLLAIYIVASAPGVTVKLPGRVDLDPVSGRITATFDNNPQLPFSNLDLEFTSGSRAPLVTPRQCGTYEVETDLYSWAQPTEPVHGTSGFNIAAAPGGAPCPSPGQFDPGFEAGTLTPIAGAYSPLVLNASRPDGSQSLTGLTVNLPPGLTGKLSGVPYCPQAALDAAAAKAGRSELTSPSCPEASQVGTVDVAAGAGPSPFHVPGRAYLAGPYKGAPLSIAVITPAVAGPFDLGDVVVRAALRVDPATAQITAVSDPIPTILQGIPLKVRSIALNANRPDFTLNPTSCNPFALSGTLFGTSTAKPVSSRFQVGACKALDFKPKLSLKLSGPTARSKNPALQAVLTQPAGQANIARVSVVLPRSAFIDNGHVSNPCTRVQFSAGTCPKNSILGTARAFTPLLDKPLEGPVYFRSNGGERDLPDIVADLNGQIHVTVVGFIDSVHKKGSETSRVRNTFALVPDAPVSKFVLNLKGGKVGLIENSANLCRSDQHATIKIDAQNGKAYDTQPLIGNGCGTGKKATRRG
jgi:hypothetical protein